MSVTCSFIVIFSASADLCSARGIIIPRAFSKSADAEKIITKLQVTVIYISNFSQIWIWHPLVTCAWEVESRIFATEAKAEAQK